jgi:hypothetical protein
MRVTQHRPAFIESDEAIWRGEVASVPELTALPFVQTFWAAPGFYQFSVARDHEPLLFMAEYRGGMHAFVVARISGPDAIGALRALPEWVPKEDRVGQASFKPVVIDPLGPPLDE